MSTSSIPFFFEPNFDAHVKPLAAALRIQDEREAMKAPVVYGDFLLRKVSNNFDGDVRKGRYED